MLALLLIATSATTPGILLNERTFSDDEAQAFVDQHNWWRNQAALGLLSGGRKASQMPRVFWDLELADHSKAWSQECKIGNSWDAGFNNLSYDVGENLHWSGEFGWTGEEMAEMALEQWGLEHLNGLFLNNHYRQLVWESSVRIGCGASECYGVDSSYWDHVTIIVCQYYPRYNESAAADYTLAINNTGESCGNGVYGNSTGMDSTWVGLCNNDCDVHNSCSLSETPDLTPSPTRSPVVAKILSDDEIQGFVDRHNYWRNEAAIGHLTGGVKAAQMPQVFWDSELAEQSAKHSELCIWNRRGYDFGENVMVSTSTGMSGEILSATAVDFWASYHSILHDWYIQEIWENSTIHNEYLQIVWESSVRIGCGVTECSSVQDYGGGRTVIVCQYYEPMISETAPYTRTDHATGENCVNGVYGGSTGSDDTWPGLCNNTKPTDAPSLNPTSEPTEVPTLNPTSMPILTGKQTNIPTLNPATSMPSNDPTPLQTSGPTNVPTLNLSKCAVTQSPSYLPATAPRNPTAVVTWMLSLCCLKVSDVVCTENSVAVLLGVPEDAVTLRSWTLIPFDRRRTDSDDLDEAWDVTYDIEAESDDAANKIVEAVSSSDTTSALEDQIMEDIPGSTVEVTISSYTVTVPEEEEWWERRWKGIKVWLLVVISLICFVFILMLAICLCCKRSKAKVVVGDDTMITTPADEEQKSAVAGSTNVVESEREPDTSRTLLGVSPTAQNIVSAD